MLAETNHGCTKSQPRRWSHFKNLTTWADYWLHRLWQFCMEFMSRKWRRLLTWHPQTKDVMRVFPTRKFPIGPPKARQKYCLMYQVYTCPSTLNTARKVLRVNQEIWKEISTQKSWVEDQPRRYTVRHIIMPDWSLFCVPVKWCAKMALCFEDEYWSEEKQIEVLKQKDCNCYFLKSIMEEPGCLKPKDHDLIMNMAERIIE